MTFRTPQETIIYGAFCFPCLFGENQSKLKALQGEINPSCYPGCVTYVFMMIYGTLLGFAMASCLDASPVMTSTLGDVFSHGTIGLYAGDNRKKMKQIEGIHLPDNQMCNDYMLHMFCSPCSICEESIAITKFEHQNRLPEYTILPNSSGTIASAPPQTMHMKD
tara:strand:- start:116 stop:607 length:492 start_codon:yes stop_codon:yes gene_type:complete